MKVGRLAINIISVLAVIAMVGSCATTKQAISEEDFFKTWSGTWVNTDYLGGFGAPQKIIRFPDGTWEDYLTLTKAYKSCYGQHTITAMWTDSKGNVWYRSRWECLAHSNEGN